MEIRTLAAQERMKVADLLDGWDLAEGWTAGDRFRQQVEFDPTELRAIEFDARALDE